MKDNGVDPTVFIVDDDAAMRKSLCALLDSVNMQTRAFESAQDYLENHDPEASGCLVLDIRMPGMTGMQLLEELRARGSEIPVIMITAYGDVQSAVQAMKDGALDFIEKPFSPTMLLERITQAIKVDGDTRDRRSSSARVRERLDQLSPRETEVLDLVVEGKASKQIAADLNISQKTVETHRAHIMQKMKVDSVAELVNVVVSARK